MCIRDSTNPDRTISSIKREMGSDHRVSIDGKSLVEGDTDGLIKVIVEPELGEILGVHLYGVHTTEMIALAASARCV